MYPDFTTSHAPDFVSNLLRIPRDYNEMANANARTQVAQQEQATRKWMAQINADKLAQEMALAQTKDARDAQKFELDMKYAPDEEARKAALAAESIQTSKDARVSRSYADMLAKTHASVAELENQKRLQNEQAALDMTEEMKKLAPYEWAGEKGLAIMNDYAGKFSDPAIAPKVYHGFKEGRQEYSSAEERNLTMDKDAVDTYESLRANGYDDGTAMNAAREKTAIKKAAQEAQRQILIERAKQEAKPDSLSPSEEKAVEFYVGRLPKNVSEKDLTQPQRAKAAALFSNLVVRARTNNGMVDDSQVPRIWDEVLKTSDWKPQLDSLYQIK